MKYIILIISIFLIPLTSQAANSEPLKFINLMAYSQKPESGMMYQADSIIPIGWSRSGYFAYIKEAPVEGRGGVIYTYVIFDSINDKIVWSTEHDIIDGTEDSFEISYKQFKPTFLKALQKFKIEQGEGTKFEKFPYKSLEGSSYTIELKTQKRLSKNPQDFFLGDIKSLKVNVLKDRNIKKKVYSKENLRAFSYWSAGYFKSPFEERILIVVGEEIYGFEGTEGKFIFIGCDLKRGF